MLVAYVRSRATLHRRVRGLLAENVSVLFNAVYVPVSGDGVGLLALGSADHIRQSQGLPH